MNGKTIAVLGALILSAGAVQAQQPTTRPADSTNTMNKPSTSSTGAMDINTASRSELAAAGWGQYADAIIAKRPYKTMNDLVEMKVVPQTAYDKGYEKFQIGNGTQSPMADPNLSPTVPSTTPTTPPTIGPGTTPTPGAAGTYPSTPSTQTPGAAAAPNK